MTFHSNEAVKQKNDDMQLGRGKSLMARRVLTLKDYNVKIRMN